MNYKEIDRKKILDFLFEEKNGVEVSKIIEMSGAEKLRVHPILFEEKMKGNVRVLESSSFGAPEKVILNLWYSEK